MPTQISFSVYATITDANLDARSNSTKMPPISINAMRDAM
jgi:hypothetical protein